MVRPARTPKEQLRSAILAAARDIAHTEGWHTVTIRRVAEHISYAPPVIYEYFANKDALVATVADAGYGQLLEEMKAGAAKDTGSDPLAPLTNIALAYWHFAEHNPEIYTLIFDSNGTYCDYQRDKDEPTIADYCIAEFAKAFPAYSDDQKALTDAFLATWAALHGIVTMHKSRLIPGTRRDAEALLQTTLTAILERFLNNKERAVHV